MHPNHVLYHHITGIHPRAEFSVWYTKTYLCYLSFPNTEMAQIVEILFNGRQGSIDPSNSKFNSKFNFEFEGSIPWLLVTWWCKEPVYQQTLYWLPGICLKWVNALIPEQNGNILQSIVLTHWGRDKMAAVFQTTFFLNENVWVSIKISLKFAPKGSISNIPALVQIMAWRLPSDKPLSEPMVVNLLTHKCVTRP